MPGNVRRCAARRVSNILPSLDSRISAHPTSTPRPLTVSDSCDVNDGVSRCMGQNDGLWNTSQHDHPVSIAYRKTRGVTTANPAMQGGRGPRGPKQAARKYFLHDKTLLYFRCLWLCTVWQICRHRSLDRARFARNVLDFFPCWRMIFLFFKSFGF